MKNIISLFFVVVILGCANCGNQSADPPPNIREQPGIEYCDDMCLKFKELDCKPYYEDIEINCNKDPVYKNMPECATPDDSGMAKMTCENFCKFELQNSIPLNPECYAKNLKACEDIDLICQ